MKGAVGGILRWGGGEGGWRVWDGVPDFQNWGELSIVVVGDW